MIKVINHYTKTRGKISYNPLIRSFLYYFSRAITLFISLQKRKFLEPRIRKVFIETISFCNNDCSFCPASKKAGKKDPGHKMTIETFEKIIDQLHDVHFSGTFALYCNNEPLLDPRIPDFVKRLREEFSSSKIEIITNGFRLNTKLANMLFESGLSTLTINHYDNRLQLSERLKKFTRESTDMWYQHKVQIYLRLKDEVLSNRSGDADNAKAIDKFLPLWCSLPFEQLYLNYEGDVILCCSDVLWKVMLGNINNNTIKEIWYNQQFTETRKALLKGRRDKIEACKRCDFLGIRHDLKGFLATATVVLGLRRP
ncbi:MAG: radical SAM/SPASM domain-containing protein [Candidatus Scalindua sp.]